MISSTGITDTIAIRAMRLWPHRLTAIAALIILPTVATGQTTDSLPISVDKAVQVALEHSPALRATQSGTQAASASLRQAKAGYNPQLEIAPGMGYTNGNALLSLRLDKSERSAQARMAAGDLTSAKARQDYTCLMVAADTRIAYFDLVRAREIQAATEESVKITQAFSDALRKRVEIGEAAPFEATRASVEAEVAAQDLLAAQNDVRRRLAALNRLLGRPLGEDITLSDTLSIPESVPPTSELHRIARERRPEIAEMRGQIDARKGELALARSARKPTIHAEVAADFWSADTTRFQKDDLGFQVRVGIPLFDRGSIRADKTRATAQITEQTAAMEATEEAIGLEVQQAYSELDTRRSIAENYQNTILPQSKSLLDSATTGFETGLTSVIEALDAQRVARRTRIESVNALYDAVRAKIALDTAIGSPTSKA